MFIINRVFKKAIAFLSVFAMTQGIAAGAEPAVAAESERYIPPHAQMIINYNDFGNIVGYHELMDSDNEVVAYCLDFENGYEIYDDYTVIEFSTENEYPYIESGDAYYGGPLSYYEKVGTEYVGIISNEELNQNDFSEMSDTFAEKSIEVEQNYDLEVTENDLMSRALVPDINVKLPGNTRKLDLNFDSSCGALAYEILLYYYYDNIDSDYLSYKFASDEVYFNNYLKGEMLTYNSQKNEYDGIGLNELKAGMRKVFPNIRGSYNLWIDVCSEEPANWGFMYNLITSQKIPAILEVINHPIYVDHWVVADGVYRLNSSNTSPINYYIVNNGWGRDDVKITQTYTLGYIYLD